MPPATAHAGRRVEARAADGPPALMRRLREHTAAVHAATEALPLMHRLLSAYPSGEDYRCYLHALHGVYAALEPALYAAVPQRLRSELGIAPKLPALLQDLQAMHVADPHPAGAAAIGSMPKPGRCARVHPLLKAAEPRRTASALGGLYVLEGSTLGGQLIARRLKHNRRASSGSGPDGPSPTPTALPTAFLEFRNRHAAGDWRRFGSVLSAWAAARPGTEQAMLDGALGTFESVHAALADAGTAARPGAGPGRASTDASALP
jgi:heme oxygenase